MRLFLVYQRSSMNNSQLSIFEKIIERTIPATIIYETDSIIVIKDIGKIYVKIK